MGERGAAGRHGDLILVVPCYNEAERLDFAAFTSFAADESGVRFLFVNDGSTDRTSAVLASLHEADPDHFLVHGLEANAGKAAAVRAGILLALDQDPEFVGFWDADLSTPLDELAGFRRILETQPGVEMVFGARVNLLGRSVRRRLLRHYIGRVFATVAATVLRLPIYDTQCGAKVFRVTPGLRGLFTEPFLSKWIFDVEILARALADRRGTDATPLAEAIYEQPLMRWYDVAGSKIHLHDFLVVSMDFARIWSRYLKDRRAAGGMNAEGR